MASLIKADPRILTAVASAFRAERKARAKTREALKAFAHDAMARGISRASAGRQLAKRLYDDLAKFDPDYLVENSIGEDATLARIDSGLAAAWQYVARTEGFAPSAQHAGNASGGANKGGNAQSSQEPTATAPSQRSQPMGAAPSSDSTERAQQLRALLKTKSAREDLASMVGTLSSKERVAFAKAIFGVLTEAEQAQLASSVTAA